MSSRAASRRSSVTVIAPAPLPVPFDAPRLRAAAFAPSRPSADRVSFERFAIDLFSRAPAWAFLTFPRAASRCFFVAIRITSWSLCENYPRPAGSIHRWPAVTAIHSAQVAAGRPPLGGYGERPTPSGEGARRFPYVARFFRRTRMVHQPLTKHPRPSDDGSLTCEVVPDRDI